MPSKNCMYQCPQCQEVTPRPNGRKLIEGVLYYYVKPSCHPRATESPLQTALPSSPENLYGEKREGVSPSKSSVLQ